MEGLSHQGRPGHGRRVDPVDGSGLSQHGQHAEVEGVVRQEEGPGQAGGRHGGGQMRAQGTGDGRHQGRRHGAHHARPLEHSGQNTSGEDQGRHGQGGRRVGGDLLGLVGPAGMVEGQGQGEGRHHQHRQGQGLHPEGRRDQARHQGDQDQEVEGKAQARRGGVGRRLPARFRIRLRNRTLQHAQPPSLGQAQPRRQGEDCKKPRPHGGQEGQEHGRNIQAQGRRRPPRGPAPGREVHHPAHQHQQAGQVQGIHPQPPIEGQHGRAGDEVGGRSVPIEGDHRRQGRRAQAHLQGVAPGLAHDRAHQGVEQAGIGQDPEGEDGEEQHDPGGRHLPKAVHRHGAQVGPVAGQQAEDQGRQHQGGRRGQPPAQDQGGEGRNHEEASQGGIHGRAPPAAVRRRPCGPPRRSR